MSLSGANSRSLPSYMRIRNAIARQIEQGELEVGEQIPSLSQICRDFGVSMITARRALQELAYDGLVVRRDGLGAFVNSRRPRLRIALVIVGFSEEAWRRNSGMFGELVGGVAAAAWERNSELSVVPVSDVESAQAVLTTLVEEHSPHGVLLRPIEDPNPDLIKPLLGAGIPLVLIKRRVENLGVTVPTVNADDRSGAHMAVRHLLEAGHRRIGMIYSTASSDSAEAMLAGFVQAHREYGVEPPSDTVVSVPLISFEEGDRAAEKLLASDSGVTAVFAGSDILALALYRVASRLDIPIPDSLAVVGFDDQNFAAHLDPPLTTLHLSYYELGRKAAETLFDIMEGQGPRDVIVGVELIPRRSSAPRAVLQTSDRQDQSLGA